MSKNPPRKCSFCGKTGHYRPKCPVANRQKSPISTPSSSSKKKDSNAQVSPQVPRRVTRASAARSSAAAQVEVSDNSVDSDFKPSDDSGSDLPRLEPMLPEQVADKLAANFDASLALQDLQKMQSQTPQAILL